METDDREGILIESLYEATLKERLAWEETPAEGVFRANLDYASIQFSKTADKYLLSLYNKHARFLEGFQLDANDKSFELAKKLYECVLRSPRRSEDVINRVISDLRARRV
jgi:hypothetical protein